MKIQSMPPVAPVDAPSSQGPRADAQSHEQPATKVSLSKDAAFVEGMREQASPAPFREDLVAEVRAQLDAGTFEAGVDMDRVVGGLMAGL